ncbi:DUF5719 family protein [Bifidobacterium avesanii]|uniref:Organic solvents resistance ABC transporter permease n=1 Tax=Bifidobacterium avesanii TaxID=1798157 RepID=A0A7K3TGY4_9BIFI|nr:DUF5719 family protein [Bifidobacterium avesanii]KAB8292743.1 hypothetical protein DSM100685_0754 [Bifidobacterium avesanii]NEG78351.1 hypothetical protein [Bifidobacterium avesanii]
MSGKRGITSTTHRKTGWTVGKAVTGLVTLVAMVALLIGMIVVRPLPGFVLGGSRDTSAVGQTVSQRVGVNYCPARMTLSDNAQYGDSAFQTSEGDIASSSRYVAFGSVYSSRIASMTGEDKGELEDKDPTDASAVRTLAGNADDGSILQTTRLLSAADGTGVSSATVSWASSGDLRGLAATSCVDAGLSHEFLVPATQTGWSERLVVSNATAKATTVNVQVWGTSASGRMSLNLSGTLSVSANAETVFDLSAAAPGQDALYVTVTSKETPVSAVVRATAMNGLTPQGNDYVLDSPDAAQRIAIAGVQGAQGVKVLLLAQEGTSVDLSWITANGLASAQTVSLEGGRAQVADLGAPPADAIGVGVTADAGVTASAVLTRSGDGGQADFAVVAGGSPAASSAVAVPEQVDATVNVTNATRDAASATVSAYDADGKLLGERKIDLTANGAASFAASELGQGVAALRMDDPSSAASWNVTLSRGDLNDKHVGAVAVIEPRALTPLRAQVYAHPTLGVVG